MSRKCGHAHCPFHCNYYLARRRIKRELAELLEKDGYVSVQDAVGADTRLTRKKSWWSFMR
eukprot:scaffold301189_cov43-Tisochrysis_lutea.AAC.1